MSNEEGQSLMELTVVIAVAVIVVGALTFATIASLRNSLYAKNQAQATKLAQQALERVRTGRDRNKPILPAGALGSVVSWNGNSTAGSAIWDYQINGQCSPPVHCYFNIDEQGALNYLTAAQTIPSGAEQVPPPPYFQRVVILSDDSTYKSQKTVTAIVIWTDFSGPHESKLTTILRNAIPSPPPSFPPLPTPTPSPSPSPFPSPTPPSEPAEP